MNATARRHAEAAAISPPSTVAPLSLLVFDAGDRCDEAIVDFAAAVAAALDPCGQDDAGQRALQGRDVGIRRARDGHGLVGYHAADLATVGLAGVARDAVLGQLQAERPLLFLHLGHHLLQEVAHRRIELVPPAEVHPIGGDTP